MPLSSTPVFPLSANDSCKQALEWSWWFGSFLCLSALKGSNGSATFVCVSYVSLSSSRVICVPGATGWLQATPKTSVNRSWLSGDSWSMLLIRSGVMSVGVSLATMSCRKSPVIQAPLKMQPCFFPLKKSTRCDAWSSVWTVRVPQLISLDVYLFPSGASRLISSINTCSAVIQPQVYLLSEVRRFSMRE